MVAASKQKKLANQNTDPGWLQTVRVPLLMDMNQRSYSTAKDALFQNCFFEIQENKTTGTKKTYCTKRPGMGPGFRPTGGNATGRGIYYWPLNGAYYSVFNSSIYKTTASPVHTTLYSGMSTSAGVCAMVPIPPSAPTPYLAVTDGAALYLIDQSNNVVVLNNVVISTSSVAASTTITTATNHNLATGNKIVIRNHTGSTPSLNDTLYTVTVTGPTTFTIPVTVTVGGTGGTIGLFPANVGQIVQHDGYLFVVNSSGQLFNASFNDPTTWSPTSYVTSQMDESQAVGIGHQNNYVVVFKQKSIQFWYDAANAPGSPMANVEQAMQQFGAFSTGTIQSIENTMYFVGNGGTGGQTVWAIDGTTNAREIGNESINRIISAEATLSSSTSNCFRVAGNYFYALQLNSQTLVYNQNSDTWTVWTDTTGASYWPIADTSSGPNFLLGQHTTNGWIYTISENFYQDDSVNFNMTMVTPKIDFDTTKRKWFERLELVGDVPPTSVSAAIYYTDDDYQTFNVSRSFAYQNRYWTRRLGQSRRRAWNLQFTGNAPLRFEALEMDIRIGDY